MVIKAVLEQTNSRSLSNLFSHFLLVFVNAFLLIHRYFTLIFA